LLGIPASVTPVAGIAIGHPAQRPRPRTRFRDEAVHSELW